MRTTEKVFVISFSLKHITIDRLLRANGANEREIKGNKIMLLVGMIYTQSLNDDTVCNAYTIWYLTK